MARQVLRPVEDVVVPMSRRLVLTELTERTCKWPNGDPLSEDFSFCGNETARAAPIAATMPASPISRRQTAAAPDRTRSP